MTTENSKKKTENVISRYFEYSDEQSSKFWEVTLAGFSVIVRYGKIGTIGQTLAKEFSDTEAATKHLDKLIREKTGKGYVETIPATAVTEKAPLVKTVQASVIPTPLSHKLEVPPPSVSVKISRSPKIEQQIQIANELKRQIIEDTKIYFPWVTKKKFVDYDEARFLRQIELSIESFDVITKACDPKTLDRTVSMLSGPFFTSKKYPIPVKNSEMLYPVVQVDLRIASSLISEPIGDGLLQLWYDTNTRKEFIQVIPRSEVTMEKLTEFCFIPAKKFDGFPIPFNFSSDPLGGQVRIMSTYKSQGISCHDGYPMMDLEDAAISYDVPKELFALVKKFERIATDKRETDFNMFGTFYPIQYSAPDVGKKCLFNISGDWGGTGNAQVFYDIAKNGKVSFSFWDCFR